MFRFNLSQTEVVDFHRSLLSNTFPLTATSSGSLLLLQKLHLNITFAKIVLTLKKHNFSVCSSTQTRRTLASEIIQIGRNQIENYRHNKQQCTA